MTMTVSMPRRHDGPWTVDELEDLPDDGNRYELVDGSLIVNPPTFLPHSVVLDSLTDLLKRQARAEFRVFGVGAGLQVKRDTFFIPDLVVVPAHVVQRGPRFLAPSDVLVVVEVLSPGNRRYDLVLKRHEYAAAGIPQYWIVDPPQRQLTVLSGPGYRDEEVIRPGTRWRTDDPYPIELDPADLF